jgi:acyl-CoA synthetase (AMP-forming)/AMP-acid ligase II
MRTHGGYIEATKEFGSDDAIEFSCGDVLLACPSQNLIGGINFLRRPLINGGTFVLGNSAVFFKEFLQDIRDYGVTFLSLLPAELSILMGYEEEFKQSCANLKMISFRSSAVSVRDQKKVISLFPGVRIIIYYGATEILAICTHDISKNHVVPMCLGKPTPNTAVRILDGDGNPMLNSSYNNPGTISCKSPTCMKGYWNSPELTSEVYKNGWLQMGDVGYIDGNGFLYLMGRKDEVIDTGGNKVAPSEIEELALEIGSVKECVCVSVPDAILGKVPKLFVVMKEGAEFSAQKIFSYMSDKLESYKLPRLIECLDVLPRTDGNMKIDKKGLVGI